MIELKFTLYQRFESLKSYINIELRGILAAYPKEIERVATEIKSLASFTKDNVNCSGSSVVTQPVVV